jgi:hypothetical protein
VRIIFPQSVIQTKPGDFDIPRQPALPLPAGTSVIAHWLAGREIAGSAGIDKRIISRQPGTKTILAILSIMNGFFHST